MVRESSMSNNERTKSGVPTDVPKNVVQRLEIRSLEERNERVPII